MTLKVIGAGYPRTGTASLKLALEQLGFGPCHHMREIFMNMADVPLWVEAAKKPMQANWNEVFERYSSCTDAPGCTFWRELSDYYPQAKVLLSVRDPEKWFESTQETVFSEQWQGMQAAGPLREFFERCVLGTFNGFIHDHDKMIAQFKRHIEEVKQAIPKERLLVFDVREGWEPLCKFLGVPVPQTPFPQTNTREEMLAMRAAAPALATMDPQRMQQMARERFQKKA